MKNILVKCILISFISISIPLNGTEQQPDYIFHKNCLCEMIIQGKFDSPLEIYFLKNNINPSIPLTSTALYRGFRAKWKISKEKLYLIHIDSKHKQIKDIFQNKKTKLFASWFSGIIKIQGCPYYDTVTAYKNCKPINNRECSVVSECVTKYKVFSLVEIKNGIIQAEYPISYKQFKNAVFQKWYKIRNKSLKKVMKRYWGY